MTCSPRNSRPPLRAAVPGAMTRIERVHEGVSTLVYRVNSERGTGHLRVLPEPAHSFAPKVAAHARLRALGVRVPEVVFFADPHPLIERSVMGLVALPGAALFQASPRDPAALKQIVADAGSDLGDMRGGGPWDDLAYFHMRDGARLAVRLLPALLRGFGAVSPLGRRGGVVLARQDGPLRQLYLVAHRLLRHWRDAPAGSHT